MSTTQQGPTTVTTTTTITTRPYFDIGYLTTHACILKIIQIVLDIIVIICVSAGLIYHYGRRAAGFLEFVSIAGLVITLTLLFLYLFHFVGYFHRVPWYLSEAIYCGVWAVFYGIGSIAIAVTAARLNSGGWEYAGYAAGAFFGFLAMFAYGIEGVLKFIAFRNGEQPQIVSRSVSSHTASSTVEQQSVPK